MTPLLSSGLLRVQTDDRLVELAAAGHDRAFEAIVERYRRPLLRYLRRLLSDALAEDVVQATFINAWSSLRTGTEVRDLRPWLYRIAHNAAINALKKVGEAMEEVPESIGGFATEPAAELERRDEMQRALASIAALPSRQRAALLAVAVDGRAHADVAQELGLTDGAVRQLVHRARMTLRTGATAVTPLPFLNMLMSSAGDSTVGRVAEVAAGAGGAGAASLSLKAGAAAVLATGAMVTGAPKVVHVVHPSARAPETAARRAVAPPAAATAAAGATPASVVTTPAGTSGGSSHRTPAASTSGASHRHRGATSSRHRRHRRDSGDSGSSGASHGRPVTSGHHRGDGDGDDAAAGTRRGPAVSPGRGGEGDESQHGARGGGGNEAAAGHDEAAAKKPHATGEGTAGGGGGADAAKGGGKGDDDDLVVQPPTTNSAPAHGDGGGGGGGGHSDAAPPTTGSAPPPVVQPVPTTGAGEVRTEPSGGGSGGGGGE
jgi:RNA polymerase sigma factor (sigma-70 family)